MKHEYIETLVKVKQMEDKMGNRSASINELIAEKLKKEDPTYDFKPKYIAKVRQDLRKLRSIKVGEQNGIDYLEKNLENNRWMQSRDVNKMISDYKNTKKQEELQRRHQLQFEDLTKQHEELKKQQAEFNELKYSEIKRRRQLEEEFATKLKTELTRQQNAEIEMRKKIEELDAERKKIELEKQQLETVHKKIALETQRLNELKQKEEEAKRIKGDEEKKKKEAEENKKKEIELKRQFLKEQKIGIKDELTELL